MLVIELELLTGVYRASLPDGSASEWPPHPERLYSALVQAWGDGGRADDERAALEWLERQSAPEIEADAEQHVGRRSVVYVYVPPNDIAGTKAEALPNARQGQPRKFPAVVPAHPLVRYRWPDGMPDAAHLRALQSLSARTASVGHSSSLVRLHVPQHVSPAQLPVWRPGEMGRHRIRIAHAGRLEALEQWFHSSKLTRPRVGVTAFYDVEYPSRSSSSASSSTSAFGGEDDWFVFAEDDSSRFTPDVLGFSHVAVRVRDALMSLCDVQPAPALISGHDSPGKPSRQTHIAVVPLASVGFQHADGELRGFGIVLPRGVCGDERATVLRAISSLAGMRKEQAHAPVARLHLSRTSTWVLRYSASPGMQSLRARRYCERARTWASVTPVLLDRHLERQDPLIEAQLIAHSCAHIGLPAPSDIEIHKHSCFRGAASAYLSNHRQLNWSFRSASLAGRPRRHVVLRFDEPVSGPVLIGAGRYHGFGLCMPLEQAS